MTEPLLLANLGAEEPGTGAGSPVRAAALAAAWRALFAPPAFGWLEGVEAAAWWNDAASERAAVEAGRRLLGAAPDVAGRLHDKAWALELARREGLEPRILRGLASAWSPEALRAAGAADDLRAALAAWPAWARARYTLKPRIGTSGRGRVAGEAGELPAGLAGALPRLAAAGGAILEPWLERMADASAQLRIADDGTVTLLGTLEMLVSPSGIVHGHRGEFDSRGRPRSGLPEEEALREAAGAVGAAAARARYRGPCGIDAFAFRSPDDGRRTFRPLVECNARFTGGIVAIGHLRRALPEVKRLLGLAPGDLFHFYVGLDAPPGGWPAEPAPDRLFRPLLGETEARRIGARPGLLVARDPGEIDRRLAPPDA